MMIKEIEWKQKDLVPVVGSVYYTTKMDINGY